MTSTTFLPRAFAVLAGALWVAACGSEITSPVGWMDTLSGGDQTAPPLFDTGRSDDADLPPNPGACTHDAECADVVVGLGPCLVGRCVGLPGRCEAQPAEAGSPCSDGDPCTSDDVCGAGGCHGTDVAGCLACTGDADCQQRAEPDLCKGAPRCVDGVCARDPAGTVDCTSAEDTACRWAACDPATGQCEPVLAADGTPCELGGGESVDVCEQSTCLSGLCQVTPLPNCCAPDCVARACGPDGCGGTCGACPDGETCDASGQCRCTPNCLGRECGGDGCGGSCGECAGADVCTPAGRCQCLPNCVDRECGPDPCGGVCGTCPPTLTCDELTGQCQGCLPLCAGKQCGDDGCSGSCGECPAGMACNAVFQCETCRPACAGKDCGPDGCGGECGNCVGGTTCDAWGHCVGCTADCTGRECGPDGCGGECGSCAAGTACNAAGQCECMANCVGRQCGSDGCGGSCGACSPELQCTADGQCACVPACAGRRCGPDGCGGECGTCPDGHVCGVDGQCVCVADCVGRECGDDGCGHSCGSCAPSFACDGMGQCIGCAPDCGGRACGDDGCGGSCGTCTAPLVCEADGLCHGCTPTCSGRQCGDDGCGGSCGSCGGDLACDAAGQCVDPCPVAGTLRCGDVLEATTVGAASNFPLYPCVSWSEQGPERIYRFEPDAAVTSATFQLSGLAGDLDIFMLVGACSPALCQAYGNDRIADFAIAVGQNYFVAVDGFNGYSGSYTLAVTCQTACVPNCTGRECGANGCGGLCGTCPATEDCDASGRCVCRPECSGRECGPDGCGGVCGTCSAGESCNAAGQCQGCAPSCAGRQCGADGCGGSCGTCPAGTVCNASGLCECVPNCVGRACGPDGCGGSCGSCGAGETCDTAGQCQGSSPCGANLDSLFTLACGGTITDNTSDHAGVFSTYSCSGWSETGPEVLYRFVAPATETVTIDLVSSDADQDLFVLDAGCQPTACLAYGDWSVSFPAQAGQTYYLAVDGYVGASGNFALEVVCSGGANNCGGVPYAGCCRDGRTFWCDLDALHAIDCTHNESPNNTCGWNAEAGFYDCGGSGADPSGVWPEICSF